MGALLSRAIFLLHISRNHDLLVYLCQSHILLSKFVEELIELPGWRNGGFDFVDSKPPPRNEEEIIKWESGELVEKYRAFFLTLHRYRKVNEKIDVLSSKLQLNTIDNVSGCENLR